jgi:multicomponent Na+:H+ antiporter subunit E
MKHDPTKIPWRRILTRTALLATLWWVLTGGEPSSWLLGGPAVAAAVLASFILPQPAWRLQPAAIFAFLPFFLKISLRSGTDVAGRSFRRAVALNPGFIEYQWRLPSGPARVFMANVVSLLSGTLSVGFDERKLTIHVLDVHQAVWADIQQLEGRVARLFRQDQ